MTNIARKLARDGHADGHGRSLGLDILTEKRYLMYEIGYLSSQCR